MPIEVLSRLIRHRRTVVLGALAAVIAPAWAYLLLGAGINMEMTDMGGGQIMAMRPEWSPLYAVLIFTMWVVMMVAMMLPSAVPTVLLVSVLAWDRLPNSNFVPATAMMFASGYLLVWSGFSLTATLLQWVSTARDCYPRGWHSIMQSWRANRRWYLSMDAPEGCLPQALSLAHRVPIRHSRSGSIGFCLGCS